MPNLTKNEVIVQALRSAGYQQIKLRVLPKLFQFHNGSCQSELEFSRDFFEEITLTALQTIMRDTVLPTIKEHLGKKVHVNANGISVIPGTHHSS